METNRWFFVDDAIREVRDHGVAGRGYVGAMVEQIEVAIASENGMALRTAGAELERLMAEVLMLAPEDVQAALRGAPADKSLAAAYQIGQFSFAQHLASYAAGRRVDDRFLERITDRRYEGFVRAMLDRPLDGTQLRELIGCTKEHVSRILKVLRLLGIVNHHREGTRIVNSLSKNARAAAAAAGMGRLSGATRPARPAWATKAIEARRESLDARYQSVPRFGSGQLRETAEAA